MVPESYSERNAPRICEVSFILFVLILIETEVTQRNHVFFTCYSDLIWALFFENNVNGVFQASLESIRNSLAEELVKMTEQVNPDNAITVLLLYWSVCKLN